MSRRSLTIAYVRVVRATTCHGPCNAKYPKAHTDTQASNVCSLIIPPFVSSDVPHCPSGRPEWQLAKMTLLSLTALLRGSRCRKTKKKATYTNLPGHHGGFTSRWCMHTPPRGPDVADGVLRMEIPMGCPVWDRNRREREGVMTVNGCRCARFAGPSRGGPPRQAL